jgi:uncharacterized protein
VKVWIDVDNPPQVQYLLPLRAAFEDAGAATVVTARDHGPTLDLLALGGVEAVSFGAVLGRSKLRKVVGVVRRARDLNAFFERDGAPTVLLAASRSAAVAARRLGIPSFMVGDYEWANVSVYRLTGSRILYPDVIDPAAFRRRGIRTDQLQPFKGLKEDITFSGIDVDEIAPHPLPGAEEGDVNVLFRPPLETSHYYRRESRSMALAAVRHLAALGVHVIFSPRDPRQASYLDGISWKREPTLLERPVAFLPLLKAADAVVCSGGTMLREAAYLGIPAYSIFQSKIGGVDRWLAELGRVDLIRQVADLGRIVATKRGPISRLDSNPDLIDQIVSMVLASGGAGRQTAVRRSAPVPKDPPG